jgi:signal transduction histidine kinase
MREKSAIIAWRVALTYGLVAGLWILVSDRLLATLVGPAPMLTTLQTILRTRDGGEVAGLQVIVAPKKAQGEVECFSTIIHDLTARKKLEAQLLRTQRLESVGQLASGIAHDLNNILAPILMSAPLLQEAVHDPAARKIVDIVNANARRGAAIIKQLLTEGNEGIEAPLPAHIARFVLLVIFRISDHSRFAVKTARSCFRVFEPEIQSAHIRVISGQIRSFVSSVPLW